MTYLQASITRLYIVLCSLLALIILLIAPASAAGGTTTVSQNLGAGLLALTVLPTATMSAATLSGNGSQTSTGSLGLMTITDARGSNAGWSLTATSTGFAKVNNPVQIVGTIGAIVTLGSYTSNTAGTYTVTIGTGGVLGTATYSVSGLETQTSTATGVAVPLGTRGLTMTFAGATYVAGEQWTISVDTIPASNLTLTPSAATVVAGSSSGVTAGSAYTYSTGSDPASIMTAASGSGAGIYTNTPGLSLQIPAGAKAGSYAATITETLN